MHFLLNEHDTLSSSFSLEVVLKCNIEIKGIASVSKSNPYERTAACEADKGNKQEQVFIKEFLR